MQIASTGPEHADVVTSTAACRPDRYVPLFGASAYDIANERPDDIPFEEQLKALEAVIKAGKVQTVPV